MITHDELERIRQRASGKVRYDADTIEDIHALLDLVQEMGHTLIMAQSTIENMKPVYVTPQQVLNVLAKIRAVLDGEEAR